MSDMKIYKLKHVCFSSSHSLFSRRMIKKYSLFLSLCCIIFAGASTEVEQGLQLFIKGEFNSAKEYITRGYQAKPFSSLAQFAYARILSDAAEAEKIYRKIAFSKKTPDSLKAEVFYCLGILYYVKRNFEEADSMLLLAEKLGVKEKSKHLRAIVAMQKGDNACAESLWLKMSVPGRPEQLVRKYNYYLGNLYYQQNRFDKAYSCYTKACKTKKTEPWSVPAQVGAYLSAYGNNDTLHTAEFYNQIVEDFPFFLETDVFHNPQKEILVAEVKTDIKDKIDAQVKTEKQENLSLSPATVSEELKTGSHYALQVGAFSSLENAEKLARQLKELFDHIFIRQETVNGTVFHKVLIGAFGAEDEALSFGKQHLEKDGYKYRVVKQ